jgi:outer membrane protein OmpA-like peptidoglycan-associated protein
MLGFHNTAKRCILSLCLLLCVAVQAGAQTSAAPEVQALIDSLLPLPATRGIPEHAPVASAALAVDFEPGSVRLTEQGRHSLDTLGAALASEQLEAFEFRVEVYVDAGATPSRDRALTKRQANAIKDYLVKQYQVSPRRLTTEGRGSAGTTGRHTGGSSFNVVVVNATGSP